MMASALLQQWQLASAMQVKTGTTRHRVMVVEAPLWPLHQVVSSAPTRYHHRPHPRVLAPVKTQYLHGASQQRRLTRSVVPVGGSQVLLAA